MSLTMSDVELLIGRVAFTLLHPANKCQPQKTKKRKRQPSQAAVLKKQKKAEKKAEKKRKAEEKKAEKKRKAAEKEADKKRKAAEKEADKKRKAEQVKKKRARQKAEKERDAYFLKRRRAMEKVEKQNMKKETTYESPVKILYGRTSTLRSGFYKEQAPTQPYKEAQQLLGIYMSLVGVLTQCMYCGKEVSFDPLGHDGDHFKSAIENKRPRGYANDLFNRVPCCSKCNSSKSKQDPVWFMIWTQRLQELPGYEQRLARVKQFNDMGEPYRMRYDVTSPIMLELFDTLESLDFFWRSSLQIMTDIARRLREINEKTPCACEERDIGVRKVIDYVKQLYGNGV